MPIAQLQHFSPAEKPSFVVLSYVALVQWEGSQSCLVSGLMPGTPSESYIVSREHKKRVLKIMLKHWSSSCLSHFSMPFPPFLFLSRLQYLQVMVLSLLQAIITPLSSLVISSPPSSPDMLPVFNSSCFCSWYSFFLNVPMCICKPAILPGPVQMVSCLFPLTLSQLSQEYLQHFLYTLAVYTKHCHMPELFMYICISST